MTEPSPLRMMVLMVVEPMSTPTLRNCDSSAIVRFCACRPITAAGKNSDTPDRRSNFCDFNPIPADLPTAVYVY